MFYRFWMPLQSGLMYGGRPPHISVIIASVTDLSVLADSGNAVEADLVVQHYVDVIAKIESQVS